VQKNNAELALFVCLWLLREIKLICYNKNMMNRFARIDIFKHESIADSWIL